MPAIAQKITQNLPLIDDDSKYYEYSYGSSFRNQVIIANAYYQIYQTAPKNIDSALAKLESNSWFLPKS